MIWGIVSLLFAFFLGPLAKKTAHRLGLAAVYVVSCLFFLNALLDMESPLYTHFVPQTLALFDLTFVADILSLLFCVVITFVGAIVMFYSARYIEEDEATRFSTLINFFTLSMLGLVLSHNLMGIFIFWEFTALCSYFLISFDGSNEEARRAAWQALLINAFGGLAMLCGLLILGGIGGSYDLLQIRMPEAHPWMGTAMILIMIGVLTKSAQFPFHFWLPNAMTAPSPASAYLHSATMVNAGIFLLFRLSPFLSVHEYWGKILIPAGVITAFLASTLLLFEKDLKRILAYTTLVSLGLMTYLIGKNDATGYYLAILLFLTHALYKAPLFLLAGSIENYSGSRDVTLLSQLYPRMKGSLIVAVLGAFSLLGLPPVLSFHTKEEFFSLIGKSPFEFASLIFIFAVSGSVAITLVSLFIKGNREESKIEDRFFDNENDPSLLWIPPAAGLALCFMIGARFSVLSQYIKDNLGQVLAYDFESIGQEIVSHKLTLLASGAVIFFSIFFAVIASGLRKVSLRKLDVLSFDKNWDLGFKSLMTYANRLFRFFQNNRL